MPQLLHPGIKFLLSSLASTWADSSPPISRMLASNTLCKCYSCTRRASVTVARDVQVLQLHALGVSRKGAGSCNETQNSSNTRARARTHARTHTQTHTHTHTHSQVSVADELRIGQVTCDM